MTTEWKPTIAARSLGRSRATGTSLTNEELDRTRIAMATLKAASILIADDDDGHRVALQELLTPRGYETVLASSGVEVLTIVRARVVDLLLLDVQMPGISGLETLRILREAEATLPCIFLTANPSREIVHQALSLRAFSVLSKPVTCGLVTMTIAHALERPVEHA